MRRRIATLAAAGLLLLVVLPAPSTSTEVTQVRTDAAPARPVLSAFASESWMAATKRQADIEFLAAWTPPPQREGTQVAQHPQEVAYYEPGSIESLICSVFVEDCDHAVRIARCESGLRPDARNGRALGLFQLLGHADMFEARGWSEAADWSDPYRNTVVAHDLWSSSGWRPWVCK